MLFCLSAFILVRINYQSLLLMNSVINALDLNYSLLALCLLQKKKKKKNTGLDYFSSLVPVFIF